MDQKDLIYEKKAPLAYLSLNRPEMRNAFTTEMLDGLYHALQDAQHDSQVKVIIIRGKGEAFCAGADIKDMLSGKLRSMGMKTYLANKVQRIPLLLEHIDKPIIASIDGPAFGGGFDLALACDLRIASERATFCSTVVRIGLAPGGGGGYFLPRLIGVSKALEVLLTGKVLSAIEACDMGIVNMVVPNKELDQKTHKLATQIAQWPLPSLTATKRALYDGLKSDLKGHLDYMSSQLALLTETKEHQDSLNKIAKKTGLRSPSTDL
ncbi:MAG: enoyl-CoA hydratase [Deltaproteobacteria bacterium]|nr:MAG: enoyl-CoA hydratase [Deltaproteobacteria bacterium]